MCRNHPTCKTPCCLSACILNLSCLLYLVISLLYVYEITHGGLLSCGSGETLTGATFILGARFLSMAGSSMRW